MRASRRRGLKPAVTIMGRYATGGVSGWSSIVSCSVPVMA